MTRVKDRVEFENPSGNFVFLTEAYIKKNHIQLTSHQLLKLREKLPKGIYWIQVVERGLIQWNWRLLQDFLLRGDRPEHRALVEGFLQTLPVDAGEKRAKARIDGIAVRKVETNAFADTGLVTEPWQYGALTNATYKGLLGATANELKHQKGLKPKDSLRDSLDNVSLVAISLSELMAAKKATKATNFAELQSMTLDTARRVREAIA
jgi:hypothetical protein